MSSKITASKTAAIILAAGQGKRMRSGLPKVLHPCAELPLIVHVVRLALAVKCDPIVVVVSPEGRRVRELLTATFPDTALKFAVQEVPQGTGDAARAGLDVMPKYAGQVLILCGDAPLLTAGTVARLQKAAARVPVAFLTAEVPDPKGYGRVVRDAAGKVRSIVEHKDATAEQQRAIHEINAGVYVCDATLLRRTLQGLGRGNAQNEYYLTDVVAAAAEQGGAAGVKVEDGDEIRGVNSRADLALAESIFRQRLVAEHQEHGVTFVDPAGTFMGAGVKLGKDVTIGVGVQLWGDTKVGDRAVIEGPSVIKDSVIAADATVHAFSHLEGADVGTSASVGPYARLRPGAKLDAESRVGNFVELKKTHLGKGSKANHLAYLGDAEIGPGVNVGAGTITCNYDGINKHKTRLGAGVFVGSNATLVAPIDVGAGAYIAAGSTITHEVEKDAVAFGRARQANRKGYAVSLRQRLAAAKAAASPEKGTEGDAESESQGDSTRQKKAKQGKQGAA